MISIRKQNPNLLTAIIILTFLLITSGCDRSNNPLSIDHNTSKKVNGVQIILPIEDDRFIIHSEDIKILQEELLSLGATQIKIVVENNDEIITLKIPDEICDDYHTGIVTIYAEGDYDVLSEGLAKESSYISTLRALGFELRILPY